MVEDNSKNTNPKILESNVLRLEREWLYRLLGNTAVLLFIVLICGIIITLKNDLVEKRIQQVIEQVYAFAGERGFGLGDVIISGRNRTTRDEILKQINLNRGDNMLKINVFEIKKKIEQLPWVKSAEVSRSFFPNVIEISLVEKNVKAIWQINEKFYPLDEEGEVINADFRVKEPILLVVGEGAPENMNKLLKIIASDSPEYLKRIKVANYISQRRWNLILDDIKDGITIKLPEENVDKVWKKLLKLDETKGILKRKLTIIDLRLPNKIVVKIRKTKGDISAIIKNAAERRT